MDMRKDLINVHSLKIFILIYFLTDYCYNLFEENTQCNIKMKVNYFNLTSNLNFILVLLNTLNLYDIKHNFIRIEVMQQIQYFLPLFSISFYNMNSIVIGFSTYIYFSNNKNDYKSFFFIILKLLLELVFSLGFNIKFQ